MKIGILSPISARAITLLVSFLVHPQVWANEPSSSLRFTYWNEATPPFLIEQEGQPAGGIIKDLADSIANKLNIDAKLLLLPVTRIESQMQAGLADVDCLTSPIWKANPDAYHWSPKLFSSFDRFLLNPQLNKTLHDFADLKGLTLGVYKGYVYHPSIMSMIKNGEVSTVKLTGIDNGIQLLKLKRIDALVDFEIILRYQIDKHQLSDKFVLSDFPADQYDLYCAYSKKMQLDPAVIDQAISQIIKSGEMEQILKTYR